MPRKFSSRRRDISAAALLADHLLLEGLDRFVIRARLQGRSWRWIAEELKRRTDGAVSVTYQALWDWYPEDRGGPRRKRQGQLLPSSDDENGAAA